MERIGHNVRNIEDDKTTVNWQSLEEAEKVAGVSPAPKNTAASITFGCNFPTQTRLETVLSQSRWGEILFVWHAVTQQFVAAMKLLYDPFNMIYVLCPYEMYDVWIHLHLKRPIDIIKGFYSRAILSNAIYSYYVAYK